MHDHISLILLLYALSATPDSRVVDVLHLRDLYEAKSGHVVVQSLGLGDSQSHLMVSTLVSSSVSICVAKSAATPMISDIVA